MGDVRKLLVTVATRVMQSTRNMIYGDALAGLEASPGKYVCGILPITSDTA